VDALTRRYVERCIQTPYSFYEVIECRPGRGFRLRDVMLGTETDVAERKESKVVQVGDCLFAKIVPIHGLVVVDSAGPSRIPPMFKADLIAMRKTMRARNEPPGVQTLRDYVYELRELYLHIDALLHRPPQLANGDGDLIAFHTLNFELDAPETAVQRLADLDSSGGEPNVERDAVGRLLHADIVWSRVDNSIHGGRRDILGKLRIAGKRLTAEVNSSQRAAALRELIEQRLDHRA
jgi:hypothetical protein